MLTRWRDWSGWPELVLHGPARTNSWDALSDLRREMERVFLDFQRDFGADERSSAPRVSLSENERALEVRAVLPGFSEKDVDLSVTANSLTLRARRETNVPEGYTAHRQERPALEFVRSYELPTKVNPEQVEAKLKNGILTVTLAKAAEVQPKRIAVKG
jgi:HSP20 family protein